MRRRRSEDASVGPVDLPGVDWIETDTALADLVDELVGTDRFGVDTEFHREKTYFPQLALVQISWGDRRALVDPLAVDLAPFARALESDAEVIMHAASQDLEVLHRATGVLPRSLFDTQLAAGFVSHSLPSLAVLVDRYFGVHLPKGDRLTDWLHRPLGLDQRRYAASDVEHLLGLHDSLVAELEDLGRLPWATEEFENLRRRGEVVRDPEEAWRRIKEARSLKGEPAAVVRRVAAWRERRAAELDQPVRFVLSDLAVVGVAQRRPRNLAELERIRGVDGRHARGTVGESLLDAVKTGLGEEPPRSHAPSHEIDRKLRPAIALVSAWVGQRSRDMSIETSMLATRADIEGLLGGDPESRLAVGWRSEILGEPIRALVEGDAALAFDGKGNLVLEDRG